MRNQTLRFNEKEEYAWFKEIDIMFANLKERMNFSMFNRYPEFDSDELPKKRCSDQPEEAKSLES